MIKGIGHWMHDLRDDNHVLPQELVGDWKPDEKLVVVRYLNSSKLLDDAPLGGLQLEWFHKCIFGCGEKLGTKTSCDSEWGWNSALSHYVEHHDVTLPSEFIVHVMHSREDPVLCELAGISDESFWTEWCQEHRSHAYETRIVALREEAEVLYSKLRRRQIKMLEWIAGVSNTPCMYQDCDEKALKHRAACASCDEKHSIINLKSQAYKRKYLELLLKRRKRFFYLFS